MKSIIEKPTPTHIAHALAQSVPISKNIRKTALALSVIGMIIFFFMVFLDVTLKAPFLHSFSTDVIHRYFEFKLFQSKNSAIGGVALIAALVATLGLTIYHLDNGVASAFKQALKTFTLPGILVLMVGLVIFGQADMMTAHATNFVTWELDGAYLLK